MAEKLLTSGQSISELLDSFLSDCRNEIATLLSRVEGKGDGILQHHHHLLAEFQAIHEEDRKKLVDSAFGENLSSTQTMMLNQRIQDLKDVQNELRKAEEYLWKLDPKTPYSELESKFQEISLERGWGDSADRALEMIQLLLDLLEAPDPCILEKFLGRIRMVFNIVILSPHAYFAQHNVLGYPDTRG